MNRDTAGQQTNTVEDRCFKNLARSGPSKALPYVEKIRHNEDRENSQLGYDQRGHGYLPAIWKAPGARYFRHRNGKCAHSSFPSLIAAVRIFRMLQIPQWPAACDYGDGRKIIRGRRGGNRPFESPRVPRIVPRLGAL